MAMSQMAPTAEELLKEAAETSGARRKVKFKGNTLELHLQDDRILVYREEDTRPIAVLRFGGPYSGTIWLNDQLIAEYGKDHKGNFMITDIQSGFKLPNSRRRDDPVQHLLGQLQPA